MNLFIDCEWNSFGGQLISMALVSEDGLDWYEVLNIETPVCSWISENVVPKLGKKAISYTKFQHSLQEWLSNFNEVHIVADWPEDVERFCKALVTGPGTRLDTPPLTIEILRVDTVSENPHNALADAKGLRDWWVGNRKESHA